VRQLKREGNMAYKYFLDGIKKYGVSEQDICKIQFGCDINKISKNVVIAPWWEPTLFSSKWSNIKEVSNGRNKVWNIHTKNSIFTYIKTGIGSPLIGDDSLALGVTNCENIIFIGSVGALSLDMRIGDIVVPKWSICGDGTSRYLTNISLKENDCFGEKAYPNNSFGQNIFNQVNNICSSNNVNHHIGKIYSTDSIFTQFAHLDEILEFDCNAIEMETAVFFKAMKICGINAGAILQVSDNTPAQKSLYCGRSKEDQEYRKKVRRYIFPLLIEKVFGS